VNGTRAVPLDSLRPLNGGYDTGQPLCPACQAGRLHPYEVEVVVPGPGPVTYGVGVALSGWVAVCVGNRDYRATLDDPEEIDLSAPCGFSMPLTPRPSYPTIGGIGPVTPDFPRRR